MVKIRKELLVGIEDEDIRLDVFINKKIPELSRTYVKKLIEEGNVLINNITPKPSTKVKSNQTVIVDLPEPRTLEIKAEDIPVEILYEDDDIVVVNKPKGMVVHPACGNYSGTLVNALLFRCNQLSSINGVVRPGIVHRIDKDTSGILVIAKNNKAHEILSQQLKSHTMKRKYIALVYGNIRENRLTINAPIGRHPVDRKKMAVVNKGGKHAITHITVKKRYSQYTLIEAELETGRTHQIRVHMAYIGHPVVGDPIYGNKKIKDLIKGQALHAKVLGFIHPTKKEYMEFKAPIPKDFEALLKKLDDETKI